MYRFMLTHNPMRPGKEYISHTIKPKCIIEVEKALSNNADEIQQSFSYRGKSFNLIVRDIYDNSDKVAIEKTLSKAWKWYRAYLEEK